MKRYTYEFRHPYFRWLRVDRTWPSREGAAQAAKLSAYPTRIVELWEPVRVKN